MGTSDARKLGQFAADLRNLSGHLVSGSYDTPFVAARLRRISADLQDLERKWLRDVRRH